MQLSSCKEAVHSATEEVQERQKYQHQTHLPLAHGTLDNCLSSHATQRAKTSSHLQGEASCARCWNGHCTCVPELAVSKGDSLSPLCSISLNKPSLSLATLKYSLPSLPASTAGNPSYLAHDSNVPTSRHVFLSFSYCCEGKVISERKNLQLRFYYTVLFSVFEMVSCLHKTYCFKSLDFNDMKKH